MDMQDIKKALQNGTRLKARYRDEWGFVINGVILSINNEKVLIDNFKNKVDASKIISISFM